MKVLIADKFEQVGIDGLKELGCEVEYHPGVADDLPAKIKELDPSVLIVRSTKVPAAALEAAGRLALIIRAGAGYDTIDVGRASSLGIFVANCPGKNSIAVAELVMGLLLCCDRRLPDQTAELRDGKWNKKEYAKARGLHGRTLGVVGLGQIGYEVATRARAFGMKVVAWSRSLTTEKAESLGLEYAATPLDVARVADAISINVAATADTENLIDRAFIEAMKPDAYLINTSRGSVIDEDALRDGIRNKGLRAGLDVYKNEPPAAGKEFSNPIVHEPGVYGTHHVGASTDQAQVAIAHETLRIVESFLESGEVPNCVNRLARSSATHVLSVRHRNRPGVLAHVFHVLADHSINVEEVENIIYHGAEATCARVHIDDAPPNGAIDQIRSGNDNIISVSLAALD
ncbi:MAG: phosphoglycerate dehydrogenase [Phycisphaerales bacterium]